MIYKQILDEHIHELALLYIKTYNAPPWNDKWTVEIASLRLDEMINCRDAYGLVCVDEDNNIIGAILGVAETYHSCRQFLIKSFLIDPTHQGKGIGTQLLAEFENRLKAQGVTTTYLLTDREDKETFYNQRGYSSWNSLVVMGKNLDEQNSQATIKQED